MRLFVEEDTGKLLAHQQLARLIILKRVLLDENSDFQIEPY